MVFDNLLVGYHGELKVSLFIIQGFIRVVVKINPKRCHYFDNYPYRDYTTPKRLKVTYSTSRILREPYYSR